MPGDWQAVIHAPRLEQGEVQIWRMDLDEETALEDDYLRLLNADEVERAGRLRAGQVRMQFLVGRSYVRRLLGAELGIAPQDVPIEAGEYGKPALGGLYAGRIHFNVAHARSTVLVALNLACPVGVDVEYLDRKTDVLGVAQHSLTPGEIARLLAIADADERRKAFFDCWTRKEAVVKADGRGLSLPLTSFEVPVGESCYSYPVAITNVPGKPSTDVYLSDILLSAETACAIATAQPCSSVRLLAFCSV